jgi:hypothetical protein
MLAKRRSMSQLGSGAGGRKQTNAVFLRQAERSLCLVRVLPKLGGPPACAFDVRTM